MGAYLEAMWRCRYFWLSLVKMDLRSRYRGSALGIGWSLLQPICMTAILCVVFRYWFKQNVYKYAPFVFVGMTFWGYFSSVVLQGCQCFFQGEAYIRQHPAPMAIYPLRVVLGSAFHFAIGLLLAVAVALGVRPYQAPPLTASLDTHLLALFSLIPTMALLLLFGWSVAVLFGLFNVRFRDTRHLAEVGLQGLFYLTPIMIDFESPDFDPIRGGRLFLILRCNPLAPFLKLLRQPILEGHAPSLALYGIAAAIVLCIAGAAVVALRIEERRLIFHL